MEAAMEEGRAHGFRSSSGCDSATAGRHQPGPRDQSAHGSEATRGRSSHRALQEGGKETAPRAGRRSDSTAKAKGSAPAAGVQELAASPRSHEAKPPSPDDRRGRPAKRNRAEEEARKLASIQFLARRPGGAPRRPPPRDRTSGKQAERRAADCQGDRSGRSSGRPAAPRNPKAEEGAPAAAKRRGQGAASGQGSPGLPTIDPVVLCFLFLSRRPVLVFKNRFLFGVFASCFRVGALVVRIPLPLQFSNKKTLSCVCVNFKMS